MSVFQVKVCFRYGPIFTYQTKIRKEKIRNPLYPQWIPLADPGDVRPHLGPISFNFMQFSKKTLQNNRFLPQSQRLAPPVENPGFTHWNQFVLPQNIFWLGNVGINGINLCPLKHTLVGMRLNTICFTQNAINPFCPKCILVVEGEG